MTEPIEPGNHMVELGTTASGCRIFAPADRINITEMIANDDGSMSVTYTLGLSDAERKWMQ